MHDDAALLDPWTLVEDEGWTPVEPVASELALLDWELLLPPAPVVECAPPPELVDDGPPPDELPVPRVEVPEWFDAPLLALPEWLMLEGAVEPASAEELEAALELSPSPLDDVGSVDAATVVPADPWLFELATLETREERELSDTPGSSDCPVVPPDVAPLSAPVPVAL